MFSGSLKSKLSGDGYGIQERTLYLGLGFCIMEFSRSLSCTAKAGDCDGSGTVTIAEVQGCSWG